VVVLRTSLFITKEGKIILAIRLQKGQRVDLTKRQPGLSLIMVGLGWQPAKQGMLGWFGLGKKEIDCDSSVLMLDGQGKLKRIEDVIYYDKLRSDCDSICHGGDSVTGQGEGDDEQIIIDLKQIPSQYQRLLFAINIYDCKNRKQHFGHIAQAFIRIVNKVSQEELLRFDLTNDYSHKTALLVAEVYREGPEWKFAALGEGTNATNLYEVIKDYLVSTM
jgi:tellurium resistance protein TerD